jgi:hypothetical protein
MGYRGAEPSIMCDLLLDGAEGPGRYPHGIYWCRRGSEDLHPHVLSLGDKLGSNLLIVPTKGFDEAMAFLADGAPLSVRVQPPAATRSLDLGPASVGLDSLDWNGIARLLPDAAAALAVTVPAACDRPWQEATLAAMNLARPDGPMVRPTRAGELLFSTDAPTSVHISWDMTTRQLDGNITDLLDDAGSVLNEANTPFRLVGLPRSTDIRPYHPLAVKELLVNALAHRDYQRVEPVQIVGDADHVEFRNPGGLVEGVPIDELGKTTAAGYRNPVVASFLVGVGAMDQRGSGLVHVREWSQQDGGEAEFTVVDDAAGPWFVARLRSRPERPDTSTGTAKPRDGYQVFYANALPLRFLRGVVDVAATDITMRQELFDRHPGEQTAPFVPTAGTLISLTDLSDADNPLHAEVTGDVAHIPITEFCRNPDDERHLVNLLNESFRRHAKANAMLVLDRDQRLYYPKTADGERKIPYHARIRDAVRTVVKVRKRADGTVSYYEHEAARWRFRRFGDDWYLLLLPGWVFTRDGEEKLLAPKRITSLSTRRAARDYNPNVVNHVWFWAAMLAGADRGAVMEDGGRTVAVGHNPVTAQTAGAAEAPGETDLIEDTIRQYELDELDIELDELVDEAPDEDVSDPEGTV